MRTTLETSQHFALPVFQSLAENRDGPRKPASYSPLTSTYNVHLPTNSLVPRLTSYTLYALTYKIKNDRVLTGMSLRMQLKN